MHRLITIFADPWASLLQLIAFIVLYLTPVSNFIHLVLVLVFIDLITGSYAAIKAGEKFSAKKLRNTIEKFVFYAIAIISSYILQMIIDDGTEVARIIALFIGSIELKSIYENVSKITGIDLVAKVWDFMKEKIESWIDVLKQKPDEKP